MGGILDMGKIEMTDEYVRVGTTLYKIVFQPLINGTFAKRRVPWSMGTLRYDHGKDFIASVPKYDGFCTVPSHVDYKRNIGSFLNLYEPITHIPQKGKFPHIQELIHHIFGEHYELGMDYFQLLYLNPVQKLPILLLVSQERNTGKSTFLNFLKAIFQDNVTFNTNEDFRSQFNADWAGKLLIGVDEVLLNRREDSERLKNLSTASVYKIEAKGKDRCEVQFFGKFIMCSNNEDTHVIGCEKLILSKMMIQVFFKNLSRKFQHSFTFFNTVNSLRTKKAECGSVRNRYIRQLSTGLSIVAGIIQK